MSKTKIQQILDKTLCKMCYSAVTGKKSYFICDKKDCTERRKLYKILKKEM